jgi:hypothetical protein
MPLRGVYARSGKLTMKLKVMRHLGDGWYANKIILLRDPEDEEYPSIGGEIDPAHRGWHVTELPEHELPALLGKLLSAWAYKLANPEFRVADEQDGAALKFEVPIIVERLERIEDIDDEELTEI